VSVKWKGRKGKGIVRRMNQEVNLTVRKGKGERETVAEWNGEHETVK